MNQRLASGLVALAFVLPGGSAAAVRPGQSAAAIQTLYLGGQHAGAIAALAGGTVVADPGGGAPGPDGTVKKQLGPTRPEDLVLSMRMPLDPSLEGWVRDFFLGRRPPRDGAVLAWSFDMRTLVRVLAFRGATLVGAELGELAGGKGEPLLLKLTLRPTELAATLAGAAPAPPGPSAMGRQRPLTGAHFQLSAPGLPGQWVASLGPLAVRVDAAGHLVQDPIPVRIATAGSGDWKTWAEGMLLGGAKGDDQEKTLELALLEADMRQVAFRVRLAGVGVSSLGLFSRGEAGGADPGLALGLYAERIEFGAAAGPGSVAPGTGGGASGTAAGGAVAASPGTTGPVDASGATTATATGPAGPTGATGATAAEAVVPAPASGVDTTGEGHPDDEGARDPTDFPRLEGMVRTSFRYQGEKTYVDERAEYLIPGAPARIEARYREALAGAGWELGTRSESGSLKKGDYVIDLKFSRKDRTARVHLSSAKEGTAVYLNLIETLKP